MSTVERDVRRKAVADKLEEVLENYGFGLRNCGVRAPDTVISGIDLTTGFWRDRGYTSKATRWIIHLIEKPDGTLGAELVNQPNGNRLGFFNISNTSVSIAGATVRIVPLARVNGNQYTLCDDWQWLLWLVFKPPLKLPKNTSSYSLHDYDPTTGRICFQGANQPYAAAGLMALCDPNATLPPDPALPAAIANATYQQATESVAALLQVNPTAQIPSAGGANP